MRFALVLHFFAAAACALRPVPVVQRRALLGGGAAFVASGVRSCNTDAGRALHGVDAVETTQVATAARRDANAAGLEQFKTLVDELAALNKAAQSGKATTKTLQKGFVTTVVPLENAARKNPYNAEYEYGELIAQKITADATKLKAAGTPEDAAPLLQKLVESTDAYCQTLNCANLLIYR